METAASLIKDILQEIYVQDDEQSVKSVDFQTALRYTNRMMAQYDAQGIKLGWTNLVNPSDPVTVPAGAINGIIFNAALKVANTYDMEVGPLLAVNAQEGLDAMRKLGVTIEKSNYPSTVPVGSGNQQDYLYSNTFYNGCCEDEDTCGDEK